MKIFKLIALLAIVATFAVAKPKPADAGGYVQIGYGYGYGYGYGHHFYRPLYFRPNYYGHYNYSYPYYKRYNYGRPYYEWYYSSQLSYTPKSFRGSASRGSVSRDKSHSIILATTPAPTVRPPSRIANLSFSSIAIGTTSSTSICTLSPGITISVPSGSFTWPVTSVVRK